MPQPMRVLMVGAGGVGDAAARIAESTAKWLASQTWARFAPDGR